MKQFFTVKQYQERVLEIIIDEITSRKHGRNMSWELCREMFEKYKNKAYVTEKINSAEVICKYINQCPNICANIYDYLALHLTAYLASFGMYRGSTILLQYFDYTVQIGAVKILLNPKYSLLFGYCPFSEETNLKTFYELFYDVYNELFDYYKKEVKIAQHNTIERYNKVGYPIPKKSPDVTPTLITKILLGVYGCCPAYDTFGVSAIKDLGINVYKHNVPNIEDLINKVNSIPSLKKQMTTNLAKLKAINPLYTCMRVLDLILWSKGKGSAVFKIKSASTIGKTSI